MAPKSKKSDASLGRVLIKSRNKKLGRNINQETVAMYTTDIDPKDERKKLYSNTDQNNQLANFLEVSEMEQKIFEAEKQNVVVLMKTTSTVLSKEEREAKTQEHKKLQEKNNQFWNSLTVPRRPYWDENTTTEQLLENEKTSFYNWRRSLAKLEEDEGLIITPFEKNPEVWKQLWRVTEKSDILVQIVDARNPLLFRSPDLERYAKELNVKKTNLLIVNKADLLTKAQRRKWAQYFASENINYRFFSAHKEQLKIEKMKQIYRLIDEGADIDIEETRRAIEGNNAAEDKEIKIYTREEILEEFKKLCPAPLQENRFDGRIVVGLSGYPNVGKSSTINVLYGEKKVAVAPTPGKTKYVQTIIVDDDVVLLDCPGLVFPTLLSSKAEMVINGLLPIDQLRDFVSPVDAICEKVARSYIEEVYSIGIPKPKEHEPQDRPPTGAEVLSVYAYMRGFMTVHGAPDQSRAARIILKDFVAGKLLYCHPPPGYDAEKFQRKQKSAVEAAAAALSAANGTAPVIKEKKKMTYDVSVESESNYDVQQNVIAKTKSQKNKKKKQVTGEDVRFTRPVYVHNEESISTRLQKLHLKEQALKDMALKLKQQKQESSSSSSSSQSETSTTTTTTTTTTSTSS
ncbi:hypothetical protein PPL_00033 [Heterostelium album PN500]|uniref:CP-type G domain-containing protein n=1 Tax=Heterostelium pallidum (strain ATCC 26659 / Pp 5 / PN500) TaxID=670386 RepID=D3BVN2_HETP5|nr:hypothetical protein PPL_00033 [Heterostelium album PN500]EFA74535.1 hypothetical protein PPL_00033 [Heterostelium album PN500]|eukprot:XP_020426669.1 hypothetical protein PPL_00033 [Heterostelium album PN500]